MDRGSVQRHGQLLDLQHIVGRQRDNVSAHVVFIDHQPLLLQTVDGFPYGRTADPHASL